MNLSGASNEDILHQAKQLFMQDPKFKKGFKFDHIWNIIKDYEKFKDDVPTTRQTARRQTVNYDSSQSDNPTPESPISTSYRLSSHSHNFGDDEIGATSSQWPVKQN
ncbi:No apical meristem-associated, C-terminal domain containing protein [Trema orientale]|uniref:No apical meristem-associated, C-terminal domain containing protein n=1 Tax=Trema orientale TaxID=63057 RepID=A0A2P5CEN3_TREOI|nr:No apical meristem-associated, C-terminal domain containing protein [Trema orientale]